MTDHGYRLCARLVITSDEQSPSPGLNFESGKEVATDRPCPEQLWNLVSGPRHGGEHAAVRNNPRQRLRSIAIVDVVGDRMLAVRGFLRHTEHTHDLPCARHVGRTERGRVSEAEHRGVRPDR